jgi:membrane-bound ClpP family serine protease
LERVTNERRYVKKNEKPSHKRLNIKLLVMSFVSLLDEVLIVGIILFIVSRFVKIPIWFFILIGLFLIGWGFLSYFTFKRNPRMSFENMVGTTGITVSPLAPKGTIKIRNELWAAVTAKDHIEIGTTVQVVDQNGLLLTVLRINQL